MTDRSRRRFLQSVGATAFGSALVVGEASGETPERESRTRLAAAGTVTERQPLSFEDGADSKELQNWYDEVEASYNQGSNGDPYSSINNLHAGADVWRTNIGRFEVSPFLGDVSDNHMYLRFEAKKTGLLNSGHLEPKIQVLEYSVNHEDAFTDIQRVDNGDASKDWQEFTRRIQPGELFRQWYQDSNLGGGFDVRFVDTASLEDWRVRNVSFVGWRTDPNGVETETVAEPPVDIAYVQGAELVFDYERTATSEVIHDGSGSLLVQAWDGSIPPNSVDLWETAGSSGTARIDVLDQIQSWESTSFYYLVGAGAAYDVSNVRIEWTIELQDLNVQTTPDGASVYVDESLVGETPLSEPLSPLSTYDVRIERDNYQDVTRQDVSPPDSISVDLEPVRESLSVDSDPAEATVYLDGNRVGTTPWSGDRPVTESYDVRVERDNYQRASRSGVTPPDSLGFDLEPVRESLSIDSDPAEATVYLNGDRVGATPWSEQRPVTESYDVRIEKDGYDAVTRSGVSPPASISPSLDAQQGTLSVDSDPAEATVYLNGDRVGTTPWSGDRPVTESYDVRVEKDGYDAATRSGVTPPSSVDLNLDSQRGTLSIDSSPAEATVYLDGNRVGVTPWSGDRPVTESYDVRVEKDGYDAATRSGVSPPNSLDLDLSAERDTISVDSDPAEATVYLNGNRVGATPWSGDRPVTESYDVRVEKDGYETVTRSGVSAPETLSVTLPAVETGVTEQYDTNGDPGIQIAELNDAIDDYFTGDLSIQQLNTLIDAYFQQL